MRCLNPNFNLAVALLLILTPAFKARGQSDAPREIRVSEATNYVNQQVVVRDVVAQVALRQTVALLNLNQRFPHSPLTLVIRGNDTNNFPNLEKYLGQRVEVTGRITEYQGRPQIVVSTTNQIRILDSGQLPPSPQPPPAADTAAPEPPAIVAGAAAQPAALVEPGPDRTTWSIIRMFGILIVLLGTALLLIWWRGLGGFANRTPDLAVARQPIPPAAVTEPAAMEEWKQRALVAEAMAGRQAQILREKLMPELAEFAKQSLVQGLYAQRNSLIETQKAAQQALVELEARLATLQLSLPERIRAYEKRIGELEKVVGTQGEEMRELTRATLVLVRKKLETEREQGQRAGRFN